MRTLRLLLLFIGLALAGGCCRPPLHAVAGDVAALTAFGPTTLNGGLATGCLLFFQEQGRWPGGLDEVTRQLTDAGEPTGSFGTMRAIEFTSLPDGDLEVEYETESAAKVCLRITKPKHEESQRVGGADPPTSGGTP